MALQQQIEQGSLLPCQQASLSRLRSTELTWDPSTSMEENKILIPYGKKKTARSKSLERKTIKSMKFVEKYVAKLSDLTGNVTTDNKNKTLTYKVR